MQQNCSTAAEACCCSSCCLLLGVLTCCCHNKYMFLATAFALCDVGVAEYFCIVVACPSFAVRQSGHPIARRIPKLWCIKAALLYSCRACRTHTTACNSAVHKGRAKKHHCLNVSEAFKKCALCDADSSGSAVL